MGLFFHYALYAGVAIACAAAFLGCWYKYWHAHALRYEESGYTPPPTSLMAELLFYAFSRAYAFVTVGPVKTLLGTLEEVDGKFVFRRKESECDGRLVFVANHSFQPDFAMVRHAAGRHFRTMTSVNELLGGTPFAVGSAATGVISVGFDKSKNDGARAMQASVDALAADYFRIERSLALTLLLGSFAAALVAIHFGSLIGIALALLTFLFAACSPSSEQGFTIFPTGSLLPDDPNFDEHWRPGHIKIAEGVGLRKGDGNVKIVPMAIFYIRDKKRAHWSQRFLGKQRSTFHMLRRPFSDAVFKLSDVELAALPESERDEILRQREEKVSAWKKSRAPLFGAVVVRGNAVSRSELPDDDIAAANEMRRRVMALYEVAAAL